MCRGMTVLHEGDQHILGSCEIQVMLVPFGSQSGGLGVLLFGLDSSGFGRSCFCTVFTMCPAVPQKRQACCPYSIDVPEVLACHLCQVSGVHRGQVLLFRSTSFVLH